MTVRRAVFAAGAAALALITAGIATRSGFAAPPRITILSAAPDLAARTLTIQGRGLVNGSEATTVTLGGVALEVTSATDETLIAELPEGVAGRNHLLAISAGNRAESTVIWIPGEGIVTRAGIRIESTESDVRILAGGARITVDPAGGVRIQSAGAIDVAAGGVLSLRGNSVTVDSATTLALRAPTIDVNGSGTTTVRASGTMTVTGSVIRLN